MGSLEFHKHLLALVVLPLLLIEGTLRIFGGQSENQLGDLFEPIFHTDFESNLLVFGSSRAATAVVVDELKRAMHDDGIITGEVYNLGMGYTRVAEHLLGLKRIARENPKALKNSLILVESTAGLPSSDSWEEPWFHPSFPQFVLPFLAKEDLRRLIDSKGVPFESKLFIVPAYYMALPGQILLCRSIIFERGAQFSEFAASRIDPHSASPDIARAGGIRFDIAIESGLSDAVDQEICNTSEYQRLVSDPNIWDRSLIREVARIMKQHGGRVITFDVPITPANQKCVSSEMAEQARKAFWAKSREWGVKSVSIERSYSLEDFADAKHIKLSRASQYTTLLSAAIEKSWRGSQTPIGK